MQGRSAGKAPEIRSVQQGQTREAVEMGMWLGRRQAFALMAGRCSTADAECIRNIRREKRYRALQMTWEQFCVERLGVARATADRIVRQLEEFGPEFFTLAQLTRVTPEEYRRLKVAVRGHALLHAGEEIPIEVENGPRLSAAIEELRRNARVEPATVVEPVREPEEQEAQRSTEQPAERESGEPTAEPAGSPDGNPVDTMTDSERGISQAEQSLHTALTELERLQAMPLDLGDRLRLHTLVGYGAHKLKLLQLAVHV